MDIVPAFTIRGLASRGALDGSHRRNWRSCRRTCVRKASAIDPAPVGDIAVGAPRSAVAVAVIGAAVCLAGDKVTAGRVPVRGWKSVHVDHGGHGGEREGGKPNGDEEALRKSHVRDLDELSE